MYEFNIEDLNFRKIVKDFLNSRNVTFYENAAVLEVKAQSLQKLSIYVKQNRSYIEYEKVSNILKDVVEIQKILEKNNLCSSDL